MNAKFDRTLINAPKVYDGGIAVLIARTGVFHLFQSLPKDNGIRMQVAIVPFLPACRYDDGAERWV